MTKKKTDAPDLTAALGQLLSKVLLPDLALRAQDPAVQAALQQAFTREQTSDDARAYQARVLAQVAAAWALSCVFVRTLEDRALLSGRRIAGEGAEDSEQLFFELCPSLSARDYLLTVFQEVASLPGAEDVLGPRHNPVFRLAPSSDACRALLRFFRAHAADGQLMYRFEGADTRFLGDLYQDLSEDVRKRFALLQTPHFVESFILDHTLTPAIAEFGLTNVRLIDPTCGSGHFLLGAFERLLDERLRVAPGKDVREHAEAALGQVYGVDLNPYAVAIARFRLTLAYLKRCGFTKLKDAPKLSLNLVVADSLLHGVRGVDRLFTEHESAQGDEERWGGRMFALDDPKAAQEVLGKQYHAVVGNPPYITCKDSVLREAYRKLYKRSAAGKYALAAPFTERFFDLAVDSGFVGLINANSFMKREFGKGLIEKVLATLDLTRVIDTAGAYIPGHGTPTVILCGRNRQPVADQVQAVLGKRGEPSTPEDPEQGRVWRSIVDHLDERGFENDYISVADLPRVTLNQHPWSLGGGGAAELKELLEERAEKRLGDVAESIGIASFTLEDEVYLRPADAWTRVGVPVARTRPMIIGEAVRDWSIAESPTAYFPYDAELNPISPDEPTLRALWQYRTNLSNNMLFGNRTKVEGGLKWYEYGRLTADKLRTPLTITFAEVATHNHFVLDRGGKVFKQTAPIIKLPETATENDHLALLAYLNSSTACFWMKQVAFPKGGSGIGRGIQDEPWEQRFAFDGSKVSALPLPSLPPLLVALGKMQTESAERATDAKANGELDGYLFHRRRMVALQEEIDWMVYRAVGFVSDDDARAMDDLLAKAAPGYDATPSTVQALGVLQMEGGHRPFERQLAIDHPNTDWFARNQYAPAAGAQAAMPSALWELCELRLRIVRSSHELSLIECPEYKRRWSAANWSDAAMARAAVRECEHAEEAIRAQTIPLPLRRLSLADTNGEHVLCEAVPFLSGEIFSEIAALKRSSWQRTWDLQRREDAGENVGAIPVPPKYDVKDFRDPNFFRLRGKLDVPKERFISYPGCEKDGDPSPLIGWAGWNHLQRAQALVALYQERKLEDGWNTVRLMPMLVGLHELMFWLALWHSAPEADSENPAREFQQYLDAELISQRLTVADLESWRPPAKARAAKATPTPKAEAKTQRKVTEKKAEP